MNRRGVALLVALWCLTLGAAITATATVAVRGLAARTQYRSDWIRSRWIAEGCMAVGRAVLDERLRAGDDAVWRSPERFRAWFEPRAARAGLPCTLVFEADTILPIDVNTANETALLRVPGLDSAAVARIIRHRVFSRISGVEDLLDVIWPRRPPDAAARTGAIVAAVVFEPRTFVVTADVALPERPMRNVREWWAFGGDRVAVVRRELLP